MTAIAPLAPPAQLPLFPATVGASFDLEHTVSGLAQLMRDHTLCLAYSGGKDSTATTIMVLLAAERLRRLALDHHPILVLHGDTGVENPVVHRHAHRLLHDLERYSNAVDLPLLIEIYFPALASTFQVKVLSGHQLPTWGHHRRRTCADDWKIQPAQRAIRRITGRLGDLADSLLPGAERYRDHRQTRPDRGVITILGTRRDESDHRALAMDRRGETDDVVDQDGRLVYAPLAHASADDVWEIIAAAGTTRAHQVWRPDFDDLIQLYRDTGGGECPIVAALKQPGRTGCSARTGCYTCVSVGTDRSLKNMVELEPFAYMRPLLAIRDYIANIAFDYSARTWLGRGIAFIDGIPHAKIQPDGLSRDTCLALIGAYLTADRDELRRTSGAPDFQTFDPVKLIALDYYFALRGYARVPFTMLRLYHQIRLGIRYPPPVAAPLRPSPLPPPRYLPLPSNEGRGLIDPFFVAIAETCGFEFAETPDGPTAALLEDEFTVDPEGAWWIVNHYFADHMLDMDDAPDPNLLTIETYLRLGTVQLSQRALTAAHTAAGWRQALYRTGWDRIPGPDLYRRAIPHHAAGGQLQLFQFDMP